MDFSNTTTKSGLIQHCEVLLGMSDGDISGDSTLLKQFTMLINAWYSKVNSLIWDSTGTWEYDDSNYTDLPIATTTIVDKQQDYEIPSKAQKIDRVEILDSNGDYQRITPFDQSEVNSQSMTEKCNTAGMPTQYNLKGRSVFLCPYPSTDNVTATKGLKIYFSREIDEFASDDTDTAPGFVKDFHQLLSLGASLDYCISYLPDEVNKINNIRANINDLKGQLKSFYGYRNREKKNAIKPKLNNYQ